MCSLCSVLGSTTHWTDAAGRPEFEHEGSRVLKRDERDHRVRLLNAVAAPLGIEIRDWGGNSYWIASRSGHTENAFTLDGIWAAVDTLSFGRLDPLDEGYVSDLEQLHKGRP